MKKLPGLFAAGLILALAITSGILWRNLQAERQLVSEMREQMTHATPPAVGSAQPQAPQATSRTPVASADDSGPVPIAQPDLPAPAAQPAPVNPAIATRLEEITLDDLRRRADEAATTRVFAWRDRLSISGQTLTTAQLQALNAAAIEEGRREAEESYAKASAVQPMDQPDSFQMREDALNRSHETNLRILDSVRHQLTDAQTQALRAQFEAGHASRLAGVRSDRERAELASQARTQASGQ